MYGLPSDINLSFFKDKELQQICVGLYQVIFNFSGDIRLSVQSKIHYIHAGNKNIVIENFPESATLLSSLLGLHIKAVEGNTNGTLILFFANKVILEILDDSKQYESYKINSGSEEIIV